MSWTLLFIKYQLKFPQKFTGEEEGDWEWEYYEESSKEEEEPVVEEVKWIIIKIIFWKKNHAM